MFDGSARGRLFDGSTGGGLFDGNAGSGLFDRSAGSGLFSRGAGSGLLRLSSGSIALLVDFESVDRPESVGEGIRVIADVIVAGGRLGGARAGRPGVASPVTAEGRVEDDVEILEDAVDVARVLHPLGGRLAPGAGVGVVAGDTVGDGAAREEPDADGIAGPFGGVDAAAVVVQACTVGLVVLGSDAATGVIGLALGFDVAVCGSDFAGEDAGVLADGTSGTCVESESIVVLFVDTLNDIDLALVRPVGSEHPEAAAIVSSMMCKDCLGVRTQAMYHSRRACAQGQSLSSPCCTPSCSQVGH